jgi:RNA recognition motif-containing protein
MTDTSSFCSSESDQKEPPEADRFVRVSNLSTTISKENIHDIFNAVGYVKNVKLPVDVKRSGAKRLNYAILEFETALDASLAV